MSTSCAAAHPDNRQCRKCKRVYPVDMFPTYRAKGYEGRRHQCRACARAYRSRWEMDLAPEAAKRYYARKNRTDTLWKQNEQRERYQYRLTRMRSIVKAMMAAGYTRKDVARLAGLNEKTVRRIINGTDGRVRFYATTEERIVRAYDTWSLNRD